MREKFFFWRGGGRRARWGRGGRVIGLDKRWEFILHELL